MAKKTITLESVLDLNSANVWSIDANHLAALWEATKKEEDFVSSEEKLLNLIRHAFEVVHYNEGDEREKKKYENGDWALLTHCKPGKGKVALRKKVIRSLADLSYENVKHITAATLLELIDRNFGGGWDSISSTTRDIITSAFDISSTQLPASRIHAAGGTVERKKAQGYEVLEVQKGTWVEAIFALKKEPVDQVCYQAVVKEVDDEDDDEQKINAAGADLDPEEEEVEIDENDEDYYSSYSEEADVKDEGEDGFTIEDDDDL